MWWYLLAAWLLVAVVGSLALAHSIGVQRDAQRPRTHETARPPR